MVSAMVIKCFSFAAASLPLTRTSMGNFPLVKGSKCLAAN
jgi:hypothetical protein